MKNTIKLTGIAVLSVILSSMSACDWYDWDLGEDEDKITVEIDKYHFGAGLIISNCSKYEVKVRIDGKEKTMQPYPGEGAADHADYYGLSDGTYKIYYHPASKVRASDVTDMSSFITFYNK